MVNQKKINIVLFTYYNMELSSSKYNKKNKKITKFRLVLLENLFKIECINI